MRPQGLIVATANPGKLREFTDLLSPLQIQVTAQSFFKVKSPPETGTTFVENAIIKARHSAQVCGMASIADDSGIVVQALNGAPGVRSARLAGDEARDSENIAMLLEMLADVPATERHASFVCVLVFMVSGDDPTPIICEGRWDGFIGFEPKGDFGFGYDPIFQVPDLGCSAGELPPSRKNQISHRAKALRMMVGRLGELA